LCIYAGYRRNRIIKGRNKTKICDHVFKCRRGTRLNAASIYTFCAEKIIDAVLV
jgi:hypothetical protein